MKKRQFKDIEKFEIVLAGLRAGMTVAEICTKYGIHQTQYYKWKEQFLREGSKIFAKNKHQSREQCLENKITKMQQVIGELTLELKKND